MIWRSNALRVLAVLALLLGSAIAVARPGPVGAQENGLASVTIYNAVCPTGYAGANFFNVCYDTPGDGYTFTLSGPGFDGSDTTVGGFADFGGIATAGTYTLTESAPVALSNYIVYCSDDGQQVPLTYVAGGIQLDLTLAHDIRCDWYNVPAGAAEEELASLTIYKAVCPVGYAGANLFNVCYETPGVGYTFTLSGPGSADRAATTGPDGVVAFAEITNARAGPITFAVTETAPGPLHNFIVYCSEAGEPFPLEYLADDSGIALGLMLDDDVRCDWYNIPAAGAANPAPTTPGGTTTPPTSGANGTTTLPNTGAGAGATSAIPAGAPWVLAVAVVALALGTAGPRLSRRLAVRR